MLSVLLTILKIIGIVLLCIIGLVLFLVCVILFVPIRYKVKAKYSDTDKNPDISVNISFLLHIFSYSISYAEGKLNKFLRIFGIKCMKGKKDKKEKKAKKRKNNSDKDADYNDNIHESKDVYDETINDSNNEESVDDKDEIQYEIDWISNEEDTDSTDKDDIDNKSKDKESSLDEDEPEEGKGLFKKISGFIEKIKNGIERFIENIKSINGNVQLKTEKIFNSFNKFRDYGAFIDDYRNKKAFSLIIKEVKRILKSIRIRKGKGHFTFGFDDPATTGQVLMYLSMLYPVYKNDFKIDPRFEEEIIDVDALIKGKVTLFVLLYSFIRVWFNKDVKRLIKKYKSIKA